MSILYAVRHGQASFFSDNYDKLSEKGEDQARALANHWLEKGVTIDQAFAGTLQRQTRSAEVVGETYRAAGQDFPEITVLEGLNEYEADSVMSILLPALIERDKRFETLQLEYDNAAEDREKYRTFHRLLEAVMAEWVTGDHDMEGLEKWSSFTSRVRDSLKTVMDVDGGGKTLGVFTSGGVIGVTVQSVLQAPEIKAAELNWRVHNGSVTQFTFSKGRIALDTFNDTAHLVSDPDLLTYR
jgi:broad specificity phosphatase PhoE